MNPRDLPALDREIAALRTLVIEELSRDLRVPADVWIKLVDHVCQLQAARAEAV